MSLAAMRGCFDIVKTLIERGADDAVMEFLTKRGGDVNTQNKV